ncbi:MAG TPA: hypothetical protein VFT66_21455 [Roseiflexaceae bacterium]|jgi:hypothetical protein|nr:hypothetical protein [Roseiflexaceae bacterium]
MMRWIRLIVLLTMMIPILALTVIPLKAEASMEKDVKDKIVRWVTQQDAVDQCNSVYPNASFTTAAPIIPSTVTLSSLQVASHMCDGYAPLLAQQVNDAYCQTGSNVAARLDPIFANRWWKWGRKFVGWACVKL